MARHSLPCGRRCTKPARRGRLGGWVHAVHRSRPFRPRTTSFSGGPDTCTAARTRAGFDPRWAPSSLATPPAVEQCGRRRGGHHNCPPVHSCQAPGAWDRPCAAPAPGHASAVNARGARPAHRRWRQRALVSDAPWWPGSLPAEAPRDRQRRACPACLERWPATGPEPSGNGHAVGNNTPPPLSSSEARTRPSKRFIADHLETRLAGRFRTFPPSDHRIRHHQYLPAPPRSRQPLPRVSWYPLRI